MANPKKTQLALMERLQDLLLEDFEKGLKAGTITPTDRATLYRMLKDNGWSLDPSLMPAGIRALLTEKVDPRIFDQDTDPDLPEVN